ncbi:MAG: hypothetical protein R6U70_09365 [Bacillota bacterium]
MVRREIVRRERRLPLPGEILVEEGERVAPDTVVARTEFIPGDPYVVDLKSELGLPRISRGDMEGSLRVKVGQRVTEGETLARLRGGILGASRTVSSPVKGIVEYVSAVHGRILIREDAQSADPVVVVNVARQLDVWPAMVRMYMEYREGQEVSQGAIIAASPGTRGMVYAYAPAAGTIQRIDAHNGLVYIVRPVQVTRLTAHISGTVEEIRGDEAVVISGPSVVINGVFGLGAEAHGELLVLGEPGRPVRPEDLDERAAGRVVALAGFADEAVLARAEECGAAGLITGGLDEMDLVSFMRAELGAGITGEEDISLTIILTEGFGRLSLPGEILSVLRGCEGAMLSVNGRTQVRAGAQRPEVLIPIPDRGREPLTEISITEEDPQPGQRVRVITSPHFGAYGEVEEVLALSHRYETEAELPSLRVLLASGRRAVVPLSNVEVVGGRSST